MTDYAAEAAKGDDNIRRGSLFCLELNIEELPKNQ